MLAAGLRSENLPLPQAARGRPQTFGEKEYAKLFKDTDKPELYAHTALLMKRVEGFLRAHQPPIERNDEYNIKFYLAMYAVCTALQDSEPYRHQIAQLNIEKVTSQLLEQCYQKVDWMYKDMSQKGDPDQIAKGAAFVGSIKRELRVTLGTKRKEPRVTNGKKP